MKRHLAVAALVVTAFVAGQIARDAVEARRAEASSVSGGAACVSGSGSLVCSSAPALTDAVGISGSLGVTGPATFAASGTGQAAVFSFGSTAPTGVTIDSTANNAKTLVVTNFGTGATGIKIDTKNTTAIGVDCTADAVAAGGQCFKGTVTVGYAVYGIATSGRGVYGTATTGNGVYAESTSSGAALTATNSTNGAGGGNALVINGDLTAPSYGAILWPPADAVPTAAGAAGNLAMATVSSVTNMYLNQGSAIYNAVAGVLPVTTGLTAFAGGGQASATAVCNVAGTYVVGTVASAADSVKLPATPVVGQLCEIVNDAATNAMNLYPGTTDVLCVAGAGCLAADAATSITVAQHIRTCRAQSAARWNCF